MVQRPAWADYLIVGILDVLMIWAGIDMYSTHGLIFGLFYPIFLGVMSFVFVVVMKFPIEAFLGFLAWLVSVYGVYSGLAEGETTFLSASSSYNITISPVAFAAAMAVNLVVVAVGAYFAVKWWRGEHAR
jgi:hypothetical protein